MKTAIAIAKGVLLAAIAIIIVSCAPIGDANPLDEPGETQPTVAELHAENIRAITNNPAHP